MPCNMCDSGGCEPAAHPSTAGVKNCWDSHTMKPCVTTRKPKDARHGTISKSGCHVRSRGKQLAIHSLLCKKGHRSQIQMCMCAEYLGKGTRGTNGNGCLGTGVGRLYCVYPLYPLNVVLRVYFYSNDKLKGCRKPPHPHLHTPRKLSPEHVWDLQRKAGLQEAGPGASHSLPCSGLRGHISRPRLG